MMIRLIAAVLAAFLGAGSVHAATVTFEATISNVTGDAPLLAELGISAGGTLSAFFTIESNQSSGATNYGSYDSKAENYLAFSLVAPSGTTTALTGFNNNLDTTDEFSSGPANDVISLASNPFSSSPSLYRQLSLSAGNLDFTTWDRSDPITATVLNSMDIRNFLFVKFVNNSFGSAQYAVRSSSITYQEINPLPVPVPASLPLLVAGIGCLGFLGRRRRNKRTLT